MATGKPWYETLFVRDYYDYFFVGGPRGIFPLEEYGKRTDEQVDFIARALELPEGARVLDLCCGHGRHAVRLAQRGYRVTGLDISAYHLRLAKAAARKAGVAIDWIRGDMREVPREAGRFDAVINMFTAFGYFDTEEENQRVLDGVARSLRKGGRFLIDTMNHDWLMRVFRDSDCSKRVDGSYVAEMRWYDIHTGRVIVEMLHFPPEGRPRRQWHSVRLYTYGVGGDAVEGRAARGAIVGRLRRLGAEHAERAADRDGREAVTRRLLFSVRGVDLMGSDPSRSSS